MPFIRPPANPAEIPLKLNLNPKDLFNLMLFPVPNRLFRKFSKFLIAICLFVIFQALGISDLQAYHLQGGSAHYEMLNSCTVRVHFRGFYDDCAGTASLTFSMAEFIAPDTGCSPPLPTGPQSNIFLYFSPIYCWFGAQPCGPGTQKIREYQAHRDFDICNATNCDYKLTWNICCRAPSITNLVNPGYHGYNIDFFTFHPLYSPSNSSPVWKSPPPIICANQPSEFNLGARDPDGDSLVYSLVPCLDNGANPLTYATGHSHAQPMGPNWNVHLDSLTGNCTFTPNPGSIGYFAFKVKVDEYRNGSYLGSSSREFSIRTTNCSTNQSPVIQPVSAVSNCWVSGDYIYTCQAGRVVFDVFATDANTGQTLTLESGINAGDSILGAAGTFSSNLPDSGKAVGPVPGLRFIIHPGSHSVPVTIDVKDDNCNWYGMSSKTFLVIPLNEPSAEADVTNVQCRIVDFAASGCGGTGSYTYQWSGPGGLSANPGANSPALTHFYSTPGTYPWQCIVTDGATLNDTLRDTVVISPQPMPTPGLITGGQLLWCNPTPILLFGSPGYPAYNWSTGDLTQNTFVNSPGNFTLSVTDSTGCILTDTFLVTYDSTIAVQGVITTSTGAPLANQRVITVVYDSAGGGSLFAGDTTWTNSFGYYSFCTIDSPAFLLKALPDSADYPTEMPTYADTALFWFNATPFVTAVSPITHNWSTRFGSNPGGPGFISGLISAGANKTLGPGDPVPGLTVFLRDVASEEILKSAITDANGYFAFGNIPLGTYKITADHPGLNPDSVPTVSLNSLVPRQENLDFRLHDTWLEWVLPLETFPLTENRILIYPNPTENLLNIKADLPVLRVEVWDVEGRLMKVETPEQKQFRWNVRAAGLRPGVYFLKLSTPAGQVVRKILVRG